MYFKLRGFCLFEKLFYLIKNLFRKFDVNCGFVWVSFLLMLIINFDGLGGMEMFFLFISIDVVLNLKVLYSVFKRLYDVSFSFGFLFDRFVNVRLSNVLGIFCGWINWLNDLRVFVFFLYLVLVVLIVCSIFVFLGLVKYMIILLLFVCSLKVELFFVWIEVGVLFMLFNWKMLLIVVLRWNLGMFCFLVVVIWINWLFILMIMLILFLDLDSLVMGWKMYCVLVIILMVFLGRCSWLRWKCVCRFCKLLMRWYLMLLGLKMLVLFWVDILRMWWKYFL